MSSRRTRLLVLPLALALASGALAAPQAGDLTKPEKQNLDKIAEEWIGLGKWCVEKKLLANAKLCLEKAEAAAPAFFGIKPYKEKVASCEDAAKEPDQKDWEKKLAASGKKIATLYDKIVASGGADDSKVAERFEGYTFLALALDGDPKRWQALLANADAAVAAKDLTRGTRLADKALALKPPEKLVPAFRRVMDAAAIGNLVLKGASSHPLKYYFCLPQGYERKKDKKWPILVCVDGAGSNFKGIGEGYKEKKPPCIVISPCTFWNTNGVNGNDGMMKKYREWYTDEVIKEAEAKSKADWDEEGILVAIKDVQQNFDGESRIYMTGFSGGGNATYMMTFKHPDLMNGSAPACANFSRPDYAQLFKDKFTAEDLSFPVHLITGAADGYKNDVNGSKPGIDGQTTWAEDALKTLGYPNVKRTEVPGMGHSSAIDQVLETLRPYMDGTKKRSDKLK